MRKTARRGSTGGIDTLEHSVNVTTPAKESSEKTTVAVDTEEDSRSLFGFSETCCHACGVDNTTIGGSLLQCAICKRAYYCGMKCFNEHLPIHQKFCQTSALEKGPEGHNRVTDSAPPLVAALQAVKPPPSSPVKQSFFDASCSESESESEAMAIQRARRRRGAKRDVPLATTDVTATNPPTTRALLACPPLKHSSVDNGNDELKTKLMSDRFVVANASLENIGAQHTSASKLVQRTKKAVVKQTFIDPYCTESESETEEMAIKRSERRRGAKRDAIWSTPIEPSYSVVSQSKRDFRVLYASCKQNKATKSTGNLMNVPSSLNRPGSCEGDVHEEKFNANRSFNIPSSKFHANLSLEIPSSLKRPGPRRIANLSNMVKSKSDRNLVYMPASPKELNRSGKIPSSPARPGSRESGKLSSMGTSKSDRNLVCIPASPKRPGPKDKKVKPTGRIIMSYIGTSSSESESDTETESMVARRSQRRLGTKRNDEHCGDKNITRVENSPRSIAEFENSEVNERVFNLARSDVDTKSKANRDENIHSNRSIECNEELREEQSNEEDIEVEERRKCCGGGNLDSTCASKETYAWKAPEWTKRQWSGDASGHGDRNENIAMLIQKRSIITNHAKQSKFQAEEHSESFNFDDSSDSSYLEGESNSKFNYFDDDGNVEQEERRFRYGGGNVCELPYIKHQRRNSAPFNLKSHEQSIKHYEWEKPSWTTSRLRSTQFGEEMKSNGKIASLCNSTERTKPDWNREAVLKPTHMGRTLQRRGTIRDEILHENYTQRRGRKPSSSNETEREALPDIVRRATIARKST